MQAGLSVIYDDNVFAYSKRTRDDFNVTPKRLFFQNQHTNSLGDVITKPSLELRFRPQHYYPTFSAGLSGRFYRQNPILNERSYFVEILQPLRPQTDISVIYDEFIIESSEAPLRTVGVDIQNDFQILQGNIFAEATGEDKDYGVGLAISIPARYLETVLFYRFDRYLPEDQTLAYRAHQLRVEPIFPIRENILLTPYGDIQRNRYTERGDNFKKRDTTWEWGVIFDYAMSARFATQLAFDHIKWNTDRDIRNPAYDKNRITIKILVSL